MEQLISYVFFNKAVKAFISILLATAIALGGIVTIKSSAVSITGSSLFVQEVMKEIVENEVQNASEDAMQFKNTESEVSYFVLSNTASVAVNVAQVNFAGLVADTYSIAKEGVEAFQNLFTVSKQVDDVYTQLTKEIYKLYNVTVAGFESNSISAYQMGTYSVAYDCDYSEIIKDYTQRSKANFTVLKNGINDFQKITNGFVAKLMINKNVRNAVSELNTKIKKIKIPDYNALYKQGRNDALTFKKDVVKEIQKYQTAQTVAPQQTVSQQKQNNYPIYRADCGLKLRAGAGANFSYEGGIGSGSTFTVTETRYGVNDSYLWGKIGETLSLTKDSWLASGGTEQFKGNWVALDFCSKQ